MLEFCVNWSSIALVRLLRARVNKTVGVFNLVVILCRVAHCVVWVVVLGFFDELILICWISIGVNLSVEYVVVVLLVIWVEFLRRLRLTIIFVMGCLYRVVFVVSVRELVLLE